MLEQHIDEYKQQRVQLQRRLDALDGAIQALERLRDEQEADGGNRTDSDTTRHSE